MKKKKWIFEKYAEILRMMKEIDSDNKEFLLKVAYVAGSVVLAVAGAFGGLLHKKRNQVFFKDKISGAEKRHLRIDVLCPGSSRSICA